MSYQECLLCGVSGPQVRPVLVEWLEPLTPTSRFALIPRCNSDTERPRCRERVEAQGEPWPIADRTEVKA
jgi:hypothetical protein